MRDHVSETYVWKNALINHSGFDVLKACCHVEHNYSILIRLISNLFQFIILNTSLSKVVESRRDSISLSNFLLLPLLGLAIRIFGLSL